MQTIERFAPLFAYPDHRYREQVAALAGEGDLAPMREFAGQLSRLSTEEIQERFVQAFDLNPAATLEIGWHLFGEQYERGEFLVSLRKKLRDAAIPETGELPDHLLHVLPLLARLEPAEAEAFTEKFLRPALEKILKGLPADSVFGPLVGGLLDACSDQWSVVGGQNRALNRLSTDHQPLTTDH